MWPPRTTAATIWPMPTSKQLHTMAPGSGLSPAARPARRHSRPAAWPAPASSAPVTGIAAPPDLVAAALGLERGVARSLAFVEGRLLVALARMIRPQREALLPDLGRTGHGTERGRHLGGEHRPQAEEDQDAGERHDQGLPQLAELLAGTVAGGDPQEGNEPAEAEHVHVAGGPVDADEQALPAGAPHRAGSRIEGVVDQCHSVAHDLAGNGMPGGRGRPARPRGGRQSSTTVLPSTICPPFRPIRNLAR